MVATLAPYAALWLVVVAPAVAHGSGEDATDDDDDRHMWTVGSAVAFACFLFLAYTFVAFASYPFVRYRTGVPLFFLLLIIAFPPAFFFLFAYLLVLRAGWMSSAWYVTSTHVPSNAVVVVPHGTARVATIRQERRFATAV